MFLVVKVLVPNLEIQTGYLSRTTFLTILTHDGTLDAYWIDVPLTKSYGEITNFHIIKKNIPRKPWTQSLFNTDAFSLKILFAFPDV